MGLTPNIKVAIKNIKTVEENFIQEVSNYFLPDNFDSLEIPRSRINIGLPG